MTAHRKLLDSLILDITAITGQGGHRKLVDDSRWFDVWNINNYAIFFGYLGMANRGVGYLMITWTTVVLLGGFVSMLQKKDFWCLSFITVVQLAGIFDSAIYEKLIYIWRGAAGMTLPVSTAVIGSRSSRAFVARLLGVALGIFQVLVSITVCPLAVLFSYGILISPGISLWRLKSRDYGDNTATEANLKPALDVLYSLALFQGVLFYYKFMLLCLGRSMVTSWESNFKLHGGCPLPHTLAFDYFNKTRLGCEKHPSFAKGRNLVTYAVDMMGSKSHDDYISGTRILDTLIRRQENNRRDSSRKTNNIELFQQHMLMKHQLIVSASSSHILHKLLQTLDSRSPYDRQTRGHAARIVAHFASYISLEQYPQGIQYISSLIDTFEEYLLQPYQRDWLLVKCRQDWPREARDLPRSYRDESEENSDPEEENSDPEEENSDPEAGRLFFDLLFLKKEEKNSDRNLPDDYKELVMQGLCILRKLAADENNCRVMSDTRGLLSKIMAPVTSDLLHDINHDTCSGMVHGSLEVLHQFVVAPGETGAEFRRSISRSEEAITTMEGILECPECDAKLRIEAIGILTQLSMHFAHTSMGSQCRENFIKKLVTIFISDNYKYPSVRRTAGEALAKLSFQGGSNATIVLQVNPDVGNLAKILLDDAEDPTCWKCTAEILEHLCIYYKQDNAYATKLKEAMIAVMRKVLSEIIPELTKTGTGAREPGFSSPHEDIEGQTGDVPQNNGQKYRAPTQEQLEKTDEQQQKDRVHAALFSFCVTVYDTFISADQDLARQFDHEIDASSLLRELKEMVDLVVGNRGISRNRDPKAHCLRMLKLTSRMVISMMKHRGSYLRQDLESLTDALSSASENMLLLDSSMVFASDDHDGAVANKPERTLTSLVKEAKELVGNYRAE